MPWNLSSSPSSSPLLSSSPSERECERSAFSFYCAVRQRAAVWSLEDMRLMEVLCWEDGPRACLPSDALLYALVHDHQEYARFLLQRYGVSALTAPRCSFCRRSGAPLTLLAVRYDRANILAMMLEAMKESALTHSLKESALTHTLLAGGGCSHAGDSGKSAVQLAVELSRAECLLLLLRSGARPEALDAALQGVVTTATEERRAAQRCLDVLLLFLQKPAERGEEREIHGEEECGREGEEDGDVNGNNVSNGNDNRVNNVDNLNHVNNGLAGSRGPAPSEHLSVLKRLQAQPLLWQAVLGPEVFQWLCGLAPPPLLLVARRCLAQSQEGIPGFLLPHTLQH